MLSGKTYPIDFVLGTKGEAATVAKVGMVAGKIKSIAQGTANVGKMMTAGVTIPIVAAGTASYMAFSGFEDKMSDVETLIDSTSESIQDMGANVLRVGKEVPVPYEQLTSALYDVRSAGVAASNQFNVLDRSARLAVAGKGSAAESVDLVTSSLNAFQLKGEDSVRVYDQIFATVKYGKTTISGLAQGFGGVAGQVADSNIKLDEYLSSVAAMTSVGMPAAQAHTQLRAVISGLTRETKESSEVFRKLGAKNFKDLITQSGGMVPALKRISGELNGDTASILKLVGSTEALNAVIGLTGSLSGKQLEALIAMRTGSDMLDEAFDKKAKGAAAKTQLMRNQIEASMIGLGSRLVPAVDKITGAIDRATTWFGGLNDAQKDQIIVIGGVVAAAGPLLIVLGTSVVLFQALKLQVVAVTIAKVAWRTVTIALRVAVLALRGTTILAVAATRLMTGAVISSTVATKAGTSAAIAARAATVGLLAPILAATAAIGALYLAWDRWNALDKDLAGSGGITGTVGKMWEMGTLDPFKAHDTVMNEKAIAAGKKRGEDPALNSAPGVARQQQQKNETHVKVDFANLPKGARAEIVKASGEADFDMSMGYALGGT